MYTHFRHSQVLSGKEAPFLQLLKCLLEEFREMYKCISINVLTKFTDAIAGTPPHCLGFCTFRKSKAGRVRHLPKNII